MLLLSVISYGQWSQVTLPNSFVGEIQSISWANETTVWIISDDGTVFRSQNSGSSFTQLSTKPAGGTGAWSIAAISATSAIAVFGPNSGDGKIYRTFNSGVQWTEVYTKTGAWFNFVDKISATELYAQSDPVGGNFLIVRSTDAGATWFEIATPVPGGTQYGAFNSFYHIGPVFWFGTSSSLNVYRSDNGPEGPWVAYPNLYQNIGALAFNGTNDVGLAGFWSTSNKITKSTDGGKTWNVVTVTLGIPNGFDFIPGSSVAFAATNTGIWKSTDAGDTWVQDQAVTGGLNAVKFFKDTNKGLAVGAGGAVYRSTAPEIGLLTRQHNTGTFKISAFNNGYIGHDYNVTQGLGLTYLTAPDAMYTAGILMATPEIGAFGMVGSFVANTGEPPIISDMEDVYGLYGFDLNNSWDQIAYAAYSDTKNPIPSGLMVYQTTLSKTGDPFTVFVFEIENLTSETVDGLRVGIFADLDVGATNYLSNQGGVDLTNSMVYQYLNMPTPNDPNYYGIVALNGMTGANVTSEFPGDNATIRSAIYDWMQAVDDTAITVNEDYRSFISSGPFTIQPQQSVLVGYAFVAGMNYADLQANALAAIQKAITLVPVELTSFSASQVGNSVNLNWSTATETNNHGFEIQRRTISGDNVGDWSVIGFKAGNGTTTEPKYYSYSDNVTNMNATSLVYRLKQIDLDGKFEYSSEQIVEIAVPTVFELSQNYPNPFNPSTTIRFSTPDEKFVSLKVYNSLGQEVKTLANEVLSGGLHARTWDASGMASGVYFYVLKVGDNEFTQTMKMLLMK